MRPKPLGTLGLLGRAAFAALAALCALLWIACVVLWVRSYFVGDRVVCAAATPAIGPNVARWYQVWSARGGVAFQSSTTLSAGPPSGEPSSFQYSSDATLSYPYLNDEWPASFWGRRGFQFQRTGVGDVSAGYGNQPVRLWFSWQTAAVVFPWWLPATLLPAPPLAWVLWARRHRRRHRLRAGLCPQCGYDLRATPDRCPECGTAPATPAGSGPPPLAP